MNTWTSYEAGDAKNPEKSIVLENAIADQNLGKAAMLGMDVWREGVMGHSNFKEGFKVMEQKVGNLHREGWSVFPNQQVLTQTQEVTAREQRVVVQNSAFFCTSS